VPLLYIRRFADEFRRTNEARYKSTSPWAVTTELPKLRVVDNAITKGEGYTSPGKSHTRVVRTGIFRKQAVTEQSGSGGSWKLDTTVQFDKIFMCPVTGREFTDADLKAYKDALHQECEDFARDKADGIEYYSDPATLNIVIKLKDNTVETFTQSEWLQIMDDKRLPETLPNNNGSDSKEAPDVQ
jgi:hypothetical protein